MQNVEKYTQKIRQRNLLDCYCIACSNIPAQNSIANLSVSMQKDELLKSFKPSHVENILRNVPIFHCRYVWITNHLWNMFAALKKKHHKDPLENDAKNSLVKIVMYLREIEREKTEGLSFFSRGQPTEEF